MRAVRYHGPRAPFQLEDVPAPEPGPGEVRVRILAAGVCHTELHFQSGLLDLGVAPLTMGHEIAGEIDRVGPGVRSVRPGDRVILYYYAGCGQCEWCRRGDENLCGRLKAELGFLSDGGYAEHVCVPERNAVPLPAQVSFEDAAPIPCGVTTAIHASRIAGVREGDVAVVYGVGAVGYGLIQLARLRGARVIGIGRSPAKLELARTLGADHVVNGAETADVAAAVRDWTGGRGADVVFELVATEATMTDSTRMLARRGRLVFIGYSEDRFSIHPIQLVVNETVVTASVGNALGELEEAVRLVGEGKVRTLVDRVLPLERWQEGLDALAQREVVGRVILAPHAPNTSEPRR
ncbi:MAG: alcohol dehydrogenase catalytic domain-containing protein [Gemmatimonadetes bacterium]|nr:alcohol dehydrogenase catalytic domain-containing protein [Gemmatimonadota bacterium]